MRLLGASAEKQKQLGAFYTPEPIARKLVEWSIRSPNDKVLDPSFGGLVFLDLAQTRLLELGASLDRLHTQIYGVEFDSGALELTRDHRLRHSLVQSDFFQLEPSDLPCFTANIGNPPYVRYQSWDAARSRAHAISRGAGVALTRLASMWAPFIVHGCRFLARGGRLAQVLPAELLHVQYARPLLQHLVSSFRQITVVVFQERVFPGALEEVILLFAEGYSDGPAPGIGLVECGNLGDLDLAKIDGRGNGYLIPEVALLRLLPPPAQALYERLSTDGRVRPLGELAAVDIGAVTGANDFFMRTGEEIHHRGFAPELFMTAVGRAGDLAGARLRRKDIAELAARGRKTQLFAASAKTPNARLATAQSLLKEGEELGIPGRYKCRVRSLWWSVPLPKRGVPDAFMTYMNDAYPRLVRNEAHALSTNTLHNVHVTDGVPAAALTVGFYNSLTLLSAELVGRSYGGGLLKLEPTEAELLLIPPIEPGVALHLPDVDRALRSGEIDSVRNFVDGLVLKPLGLSDSDLALLDSGRAKLLARRRTRSKKTRFESPDSSHWGAPAARERAGAAGRAEHRLLQSR